jgi:hypothetical protein
MMDSRIALANRHRQSTVYCIHLFNVFSPKPANILQTAEFEDMVMKSIIFRDTSSTTTSIFKAKL